MDAIETLAAVAKLFGFGCIVLGVATFACGGVDLVRDWLADRGR